jgi:hypothetical protein
MIESRLTLVGEVERVGRRYMAVYRCVCGVEKQIDIHKVASGHTRSCGCLMREVVRARQTKHGKYYEPEHTVWCNMKKRCSEPRYQQWYGNVKICQRWLDSYEDFLLDVGRKPSPTASLDRIDFKGNYEPGNVRWTTRAVQSRNTKNHSTNKTGVRGVSWSQTKNKWRAAIYVDGKQKHLGYFENVSEAARARTAAERLYWGELK